MELITKIKDNLNQTLLLMTSLGERLNFETKVLSTKYNYGEFGIRYLITGKEPNQMVEMEFFLHDNLLLFNPCYELKDLDPLTYKVFRETIDLAKKMNIELILGG